MKPIPTLGIAAAAVALGLGIAAVQVLPFLAYIPFSPRADGGLDQGWAFASTYALPPSEVFTLLLPQFNGVLEHYWGSNPIKLHTEYMGALPLLLAALAFGDRARRRLVWTFAAFALSFLLLSFGGHSPFYRPFYEFLSMLKKIRAMGMVFYLPAFFLCLLAGVGAERVLSRAVSIRALGLVGGAVALFALLGVVGGLQGLAESMALDARYAAVVANAPYLQAGALRLLAVVAVALAVLMLSASAKLTRTATASALVVIVALDLWSVNRAFFTFSPRADVLFADDAITSTLKQQTPPYRVLDAGQSYGWSLLMAYRIPTARGYHGFELSRYDELAGQREAFRNLLSPSLLDLFAIRYLILPAPQEAPGFHEVVEPITTTFGTPAVLYERDTVPPYARVVPMSAKLAVEDAVPTILDSRFPADRVAVFEDTASVTSPPAQQPFQAPSASASVTRWEPGAMDIAVTGSEAAPSHLLIAENWYKDWHAEVDGAAAVVRRANHTMLSVDLPPGARAVRLWFDSREYAMGKRVSLVCVLMALGLVVLGVVRERREVS